MCNGQRVTIHELRIMNDSRTQQKNVSLKNYTPMEFPAREVKPHQRHLAYRGADDRLYTVKKRGRGYGWVPINEKMKMKVNNESEMILKNNSALQLYWANMKFSVSGLVQMMLFWSQRYLEHCVVLDFYVQNLDEKELTHTPLKPFSNRLRQDCLRQTERWEEWNQ